jgi:hypothetical protein
MLCLYIPQSLFLLNIFSLVNGKYREAVLELIDLFVDMKGVNKLNDKNNHNSLIFIFITTSIIKRRTPTLSSALLIRMEYYIMSSRWTIFCHDHPPPDLACLLEKMEN